MQGAGSANHGGESVIQWYRVVRTLVESMLFKYILLFVKVD